MMALWLHALQQLHFSIIHRPGDDHGYADGVSRAPMTPCRQCTRPDCPPVVSLPVSNDQPFDSESTGSSEDADLIPIHSGEDWVAQLDDDLSPPTAVAGDSFRISALQHEDPNCITLHTWISSGEFPSWNEVKAYIRNFARYGIIVTIFLWTITELFGGSVVHRVHYYSYLYLNLVEMIPDGLLPQVGSEVRIDLRHIVTLQLGPATDIGEDNPPPGLALALCKKPHTPTPLTTGRRLIPSLPSGGM